jgi:hypothetical protein
MVKRILLSVAVAATLVAPAAQPAMAKISSVDTSCSNGGGNQPGGQQPTCTGGGLTQNSENQNPAGNAPPGQN